MLVQALAAPLPVQLLANRLGKQKKMAHMLGPLHPVRDLQEVPGFLLQSDTNSVFESISLFTCNSAFQINVKTKS